MSRRNKRLAFRKMRTLVRYIMAKLPDRDIDELALKVRCLLYMTDVVYQHEYGKPLLPKGFRWIAAEDGPELVWRPKGDRKWQRRK